VDLFLILSQIKVVKISVVAIAHNKYINNNLKEIHNANEQDHRYRSTRR
jgi:hypothetical protein